MIVKRNFSPRRIWGYIKSQVLFIALWSALVWGVYYFTGLFVLLFAALLPFGLLSFFSSDALFALSWLIIPLSALVAGVFVIMERTGAANEDPFENRITDVPLTALCNTIERDLRELLGERALPERTPVVDGYLF